MSNIRTIIKSADGVISFKKYMGFMMDIVEVVIPTYYLDELSYQLVKRYTYVYVYVYIYICIYIYLFTRYYCDIFHTLASVKN